MKTKLLLSVLIALSLTACETCREYPRACTAAVLIVGTSVALSAQHGNGNPTPNVGINPPNCTTNPESCK